MSNPMFDLMVQGQRLLLFVDGGKRELHRMSVQDMRAEFFDHQIEALNDHGVWTDRDGAKWIDMVFAAEHYAKLDVKARPATVYVP